MLLLLLALKLFLIFTRAGDLEAQRDVTFEEAKQFAEENGLMFVRLKLFTMQYAQWARNFEKVQAIKTCEIK